MPRLGFAPVRPSAIWGEPHGQCVTKLILRATAAVSQFFGMRSRDESDPRSNCKRGRMAGEGRPLAVRDETDDGYGHCQVAVALKIYTRCGFASWDAAAEAAIERAVDRHYARLPLSCALVNLAGPPRRG